MKSFLMILIFLIASSVNAKTYHCVGQPGEPVVRVSTDKGKEVFQYFVDGELTLHLSLPPSAIHHSPHEVPPSLSIFYQYWGESIVQLYGRIVENGALFDINSSGMAGDVVRTLKNYNCR